MIGLQSRYGEAEQLYRQVIRGMRQVLGDAPDSLDARNDLAWVIGSQNRHEEAEQLLRLLLPDEAAALGNDHPDTFETRRQLARVVQNQGRYAEAEELYRQVLAARKRILGGDHPATSAVRGNLASIAGMQVRHREAGQLYRQVPAGQQRILGNDNPVALTTMHTLANEVAKLTHLVDGRPRIIADPPLLVPVTDLLPKQMDQAAFEGQIQDLLGKYRQTLETNRQFLLETFEFADLARKVVGVGSVGTRCWIVLMLGRDESDPLFLQVKEAEASVLSRFVGASKYDNQGQRVVAGQQLMQASSDIFLGWQRTEAGLDGKQRDFYVRQLRDWKYSIAIEALIPRGMRTYGELCGWTLARAHACSGDRIAIGAYLGGSDVFDKAITQFAAAYADQNERDHQSSSTPSHQASSPENPTSDIGGRATRRTCRGTQADPGHPGAGEQEGTGDLGSGQPGRSGQNAMARWQWTRKADINGRHDHVGPAGHCAGQFNRGPC